MQQVFLLYVFNLISFKWLITLINFVFIFYLTVKHILPSLHLIYHYIRITDDILPCHPIWGHMRELISDFPNLNYDFQQIATKVHGFRLTLSKLGKGIIIAWITWIPAVVVCNHSAVEIIMKKKNVTKPSFYKFIPLGEGLLTSPVAKWRIRRKLIEPFFVTRKQREFVSIMDYEMSQLAVEIKGQTNRPVDIGSLIPPKSLSIIMKAVHSLDDCSEFISPMINLIDSEMHFFLHRAMNPILWFDFIFQYFKHGNLDSNRNLPQVSKVAIEVAEKAKKQRSVNHGINQNNLWDIAEANGDYFDEKGVLEEMTTMVAAGYETVSTSIRFTLFAVGNNHDIQERLYQEIISIFPDDKPADNLDDIRKCVYLDQCVKESLRVYPPITFVARTLEEEVSVEGKKLLKGSMVIIAISAIHFDPQVYPNPEKFDPDRWSPENVSNIPVAAFIPFGYGPRNCIGYRYALNQIKIALIHIIRKYKIQSLHRLEDMECRSEIILKANRPIEITFTSR